MYTERTWKVYATKLQGILSPTIRQICIFSVGMYALSICCYTLGLDTVKKIIFKTFNKLN